MDKLRVYGTNWCGTSRRVVRTLDEHHIDYEWIDIDQDPEGEKLVMETNNGFRSVPTLFFPDGTILVEPRNQVLLDKLNSLN
ncbi:MAG: glutathione S-transferase N-terminal domain-containing protein [Anaerolineaceae bacterium]|nr:glutathione S-transferase N-terminal domain-containing protein [Anaerolineaceae bacterium]